MTAKLVIVKTAEFNIKECFRSFIMVGPKDNRLMFPGILGHNASKQILISRCTKFLEEAGFTVELDDRT